MKGFIKVTVPELGEVWINVSHVVQFYFNGSCTAIHLSTPRRDENGELLYLLEVEESLRDILRRLESA